MTYYEKGEHFLQEKHTTHGYSKETLDEQRWQRGAPTKEQSYNRVIDDYRRTDYGYRPDDGFVFTECAAALGRPEGKQHESTCPSQFAATRLSFLSPLLIASSAHIDQLPLASHSNTFFTSDFRFCLSMTRRRQRSFDEDDLRCYLDGSYVSLSSLERPDPVTVTVFHPEPLSVLNSDYVATVFPPDLPSTSLSTVFLVRRQGSLHNLREPVYSAKNGSRSEFNSPTGAVSRPGSPGPVAGAGDIVNTEHGFTIQLDVKHFRANEIKVSRSNCLESLQVVLNDDLLCVTGERIEECGDGQTLRRSFSRKYSIPSDIKLESIRSHLTDGGVLVINGSRRGWKETSISLHDAPRRASSIISTV